MFPYVRDEITYISWGKASTERRYQPVAENFISFARIDVAVENCWSEPRQGRSKQTSRHLRPPRTGGKPRPPVMGPPVS